MNLGTFDQFKSALRAISVGALVGFGVGGLAGGVGSRIAMRISGIAAGEEKQGDLTDANFIVGQFSVSGTMELMLFGGVFAGLFGGLIYAAVRPWFGDTGRWRGLAFGFFLLAALGWTVIEGGNADFHELGPPILNIPMYASLFLIVGALIAPLYHWIHRALPEISLSPSGGASGILQAFGLLLAVLTVLSLAADYPGLGGPKNYKDALLRGFAIYLIVVTPAVRAAIAKSTGRFDRISDLKTHRGIALAAIAYLALPILVGLVLDISAIAQILRANH